MRIYKIKADYFYCPPMIREGAGDRTLDPRLKRPLLYLTELHPRYFLKKLNIRILCIEVNKKIDEFRTLYTAAYFFLKIEYFWNYFSIFFDC